jgi:hypothetical protein
MCLDILLLSPLDFSMDLTLHSYYFLTTSACVCTHIEHQQGRVSPWTQASRSQHPSPCESCEERGRLASGYFHLIVWLSLNRKKSFPRSNFILRMKMCVEGYLRLLIHMECFLDFDWHPPDSSLLPWALCLFADNHLLNSDFVTLHKHHWILFCMSIIYLLHKKQMGIIGPRTLVGSDVVLYWSSWHLLSQNMWDSKELAMPLAAQVN